MDSIKNSLGLFFEYVFRKRTMAEKRSAFLKRYKRNKSSNFLRLKPRKGYKRVKVGKTYKLRRLTAQERWALRENAKRLNRYRKRTTFRIYHPPMSYRKRR